MVFSQISGEWESRDRGITKNETIYVGLLFHVSKLEVTKLLEIHHPPEFLQTTNLFRFWSKKTKIKPTNKSQTTPYQSAHAIYRA